MINFSKPKNPLILQFLISFLLNNPYTYPNGPCHDMFNCIKYNLNGIEIDSNTEYKMKELKINVKIGKSDTNTKKINLYFFPNDIKYYIKLNEENIIENFIFTIENNYLIVTRLDQKTGWEKDYSVDICIESNESIYLFQECGNFDNILNCYVSLNGMKILDSRDRNYFENKGW